MKDRRTWIRVLWCEIATSAVVLTGDLPWWLSLFLLLAIPFIGLQSPSSPWLGAARRWSSAMAALYLFFFPLDWFYLSGRLIFATVHLMFYLKLHTLLHQASPRERARLHLICLFEMLAAASMTVDAVFVLPLTLFVLLGTLVLVLEQTLPQKLEPALFRPALRTSLVVGIPVLLVAALVFVSLPRTSYGGFRLGGISGVTVTGFSEQIRLGDFERIQRSRDVVMRIVTEGGLSPPWWRGPAYDRYENGSWHQSLSGVSSLPQAPSGGFLLDRPSREPRVRSEVFLEPLDTDVVFLPPASTEIATTERYVFIDPYLTLRSGRSARAGRRYAVLWRPGATPNSSAVGSLETLSPRRRLLFTHMPELSQRFHELAAAVVPEGATLAAAEETERYLKSTYGYSLQQPRHRNPEPLEAFLFETRAGHCEYFATAMVMMLRSRGVPSRLVTGFTRGEKNALGEFEVVRKSNAHAWVEVYDERRGWVAFDPTPPSPEAGAARGAGLFAQGIDSVRMLWDMYIVAFDAERQRGVLGGATAIGGAALAAFGKGLRVVRSNGKTLAGVALAVLTLGLLGRTTWGLRLRLRLPIWRLRRRGRRAETRVGFYARLLDRLRLLGIEKPPGQTAAEFAREWENHLPGLIELTELYYRVRFGEETLSSQEAAKAEHLSIAICLAAISDGGRAA